MIISFSVPMLLFVNRNVGRIKVNSDVQRAQDVHLSGRRLTLSYIEYNALSVKLEYPEQCIKTITNT